MSSRTESPPAAVWTGAIVATLAAAAALRVAGLNSGLWFDEIVTLVESARLPFREIVTEFPGVNAHPLYSVLAHASLVTFGDTAWALRLPAAVFGVITVGMVYVLGARLASRAEAWAGAALLAVSYHHIWFSQNARGYTLLGALTLATTLLLLRAAESERTRDLVLYGLACVAGVYTHLTMAFVVGGQALVVIAGRAAGWSAVRPRTVAPLVWAWAGAAVVSTALYAPFLDGLLAEMNSPAPRQAAQVATVSWAVSEAVRQLLSGGALAALGGALVAAAGAWSLFRREPLAVGLLIAPAVVTGVALVALGHPIRPRFFFFLAGGGAIFAGRGIGVIADVIARGPARRHATAALVCLTLVLLAGSALALPRNYRVPKQDFAGAVRYLDDAAARGVRVAAAGPACVPLHTYYERGAWPCLTTMDDWRGVTTAPGESLVVHTLTDYVADPEVAEALRTRCRSVARFAGTLGGGDVVVCAPAPAGPVELQGDSRP